MRRRWRTSCYYSDTTDRPDDYHALLPSLGVLLLSAPSSATPPLDAPSASSREIISAAARHVLADHLRTLERDESGDALTALQRALVTALPAALASDVLTSVEPLATELGALAHRRGIPLPAVVARAHHAHTHTMEAIIGHLTHTDHAGLLTLLQISRVLRDLSAAAVAGYQDAALALLTTQALTDGLTGIANRRAFDARLDEEIQRAARFGHAMALVLLDIDGLKRMNDTRGHVQGDALVRAVASVLREQARGIDLVARIGGDEFAVIVPEADRGGADALAQRLARTVSARQVDGAPLRVSMGVAVYPEDGATPPALIAQADHLMYADKRRAEAVPPR